MEYQCSCGDSYGELAQVSRIEFPKARKPYRCCECNEEIKPGQKYHLFTGLWDGSWDTIRTCMPCYQIRCDFCSDGFVFGELRESIQECLGFDYIEVPEEEE